MLNKKSKLEIYHDIRNKKWDSLFKGASPKIFDNARDLRLNNKTKAEEILWQYLRNKKISGCKFRRQHPISDYVADFYCHEKKLIIEVDGEYHLEKEQMEYDFKRTNALTGFGIRLIRFSNVEVFNETEAVIKKIKSAVMS